MIIFVLTNFSTRRETLQAEIEFGALDAFNTQARDVLLTIGAVVLGVQIRHCLAGFFQNDPVDVST